MNCLLRKSCFEKNISWVFAETKWKYDSIHPGIFCYFDLPPAPAPAPACD